MKYITNGMTSKLSKTLQGYLPEHNLSFETSAELKVEEVGTRFYITSVFSALGLELGYIIETGDSVEEALDKINSRGLSRRLGTFIKAKLEDLKVASDNAKTKHFGSEEKKVVMEIKEELPSNADDALLRKLKVITEAAETLIVQIDTGVTTEKAVDAEEVIETLKEATKEPERLSAESKNNLMMKFYKGLGDFDIKDATVIFSFDNKTRLIQCVVGNKTYDIVKLDAGVHPNKWAMDGRRNWRQFKKFVESVKVTPEVKKDPLDEIVNNLEELKNKQEKMRVEWEAEREKFEDKWRAFEKLWMNAPQSSKSRLFEILGITDEKDLKKGYRAWLKKNHPDLNPNADLSLVQEVNALMDEVSK